MLQSTVNLLGGTSTVWNSHYLKKILRIPEDQLKILNNIPGWTSEAESNRNSQTFTTSVKKGNQQSSLKAISSTSTFLQKDSAVVVKRSEELSKDTNETEKFSKDSQQSSSKLVTSTFNQKDTEIDFSKSEELCKDNNKGERFPLRKSSSFDSVSTNKVYSSYQTLKRSSSTSSLNEKAISSKNSSDLPNFKNKVIFIEKSLSKIEETEKMQVDVDHLSPGKAHFSNSGVQCKMSQEINLESDISQTNAARSFPSSIPMERESLKHLNSISPTIQTHETIMPTDKILQINLSKSDAGLFSKENLPGKSKVDADESLLSQPVPCAQPRHENIYHEKELIADHKDITSTSQKNNFNSVSKSGQSSLEKVAAHLSSKRKRKSRSEKSKKHRGECVDIKIEYSVEQIKNMIELVKVLHKY